MNLTFQAIFARRRWSIGDRRKNANAASDASCAQRKGHLIGTIVTQVFHDHTRFRLPHPPGVLALEETETGAIVEALSHTSVRLRGTELEGSPYQVAARQEQPGWEYSVVEARLAPGELGRARLESSSHPLFP